MVHHSMYYFGKALKDFFSGKQKTSVFIVRDDCLRDEHFITHYFRNQSQFSDIERTAIDKCHGKILDLGAGVGPHSLELQEKGYQVDALDINEDACEIMKLRGVNNIICGSFYDLKDKQYDTILSLGSSLGFVGTIAGFVDFLKQSRHVLTQNGQIIFDWVDIRTTSDQIHLKYQQNNINYQRYLGEIRFQIEYQGQKGAMFNMLQLDPDKLHECCEKLNWNLILLKKKENGEYLAHIRQK
jgi:SAM-dependent methyltransferase